MCEMLLKVATPADKERSVVPATGPFTEKTLMLALEVKPVVTRLLSSSTTSTTRGESVAPATPVVGWDTILKLLAWPCVNVIC